VSGRRKSTDGDRADQSDDSTDSAQLTGDSMTRLPQHAGNVSNSLPPASLQVNVIKNEAYDIAHYSPLDNVDQIMESARLPDDKVNQVTLAQYKAYKTVVQHSTADADHSRGQGSTDQNPTREASTIKVVTTCYKENRL
jgi:CubicO group peptidase (beta-lactamase class C family)